MEADTRDSISIETLQEQLRLVKAENRQLRGKHRETIAYIRDRVDQLLGVIGTIPLEPDELDDETLIQLDPIGIISDTFVQILEHLQETNLNLQAAKNDIQAIFNSVGEGILVLNTAGEIIAHNKKMMDIFVGNKQKVLGKTCRAAVCRGESSAGNCLFEMVKNRMKSRRIHAWKNRSSYYDIIATPVLDNDGVLQRVVILYLDITRRKKSEAALLDSEDHFRDLFENATDMLQSIEPGGKILLVNKAWRETMEYEEEEVVGRNVFEFIHPDYRDGCSEDFANILLDGREVTCQTVFMSKSGKEIPVEGRVNCRFVDGKPLALRTIYRNVSEKLKMEEELRRAQKLESVGILAGGIAHDFNNFLTGILGNILLAQLKDPDDDLARLLKNTENAACRAQELTRQLLTFSKGGAPVKETASVLDIIKEIVPFTLSGSNTKWILQTEEGISPVDVDTGQFCQVLENLVINSDQAMPDGGLITVRVCNYTQEGHSPDLLAVGSYVKIDIQDQGIGIAEKYRSRIFDPYFTTKEKGSGLGLATAYSTIRRHKGLLTVDSVPGEGTTMSIYLPASEGKLLQGKTSVPELPTGSGRILLMDDDDVVLQVGREMLTLLGYEVVTSEDGEEALEKYEEALAAGTRFDVVILDLTIPGKMGGREAVTRLHEIDSQVKAIVSSGYSHDPIMAEFHKYGFAGVIPKPYSFENLGAAVRPLVPGSDQ